MTTRLSVQLRPVPDVVRIPGRFAVRPRFPPPGIPGAQEELDDADVDQLFYRDRQIDLREVVRGSRTWLSRVKPLAPRAARGLRRPRLDPPGGDCGCAVHETDGRLDKLNPRRKTRDRCRIQNEDTLIPQGQTPGPRHPGRPPFPSPNCGTPELLRQSLPSGVRVIPGCSASIRRAESMRGEAFLKIVIDAMGVISAPGSRSRAPSRPLGLRSRGSPGRVESRSKGVRTASITAGPRVTFIDVPGADRHGGGVPALRNRDVLDPGRRPARQGAGRDVLSSAWGKRPPSSRSAGRSWGVRASTSPPCRASCRSSPAADTFSRRRGQRERPPRTCSGSPSWAAFSWNRSSARLSRPWP